MRRGWGGLAGASVVLVVLLSSLPSGAAAGHAPVPATPAAVLAGTDVPSTSTFSSGSATWVNLTGSLASSPSPRMYPAMAFDPQLGGVLLFGGIAYHTLLGANATYNDSWLFANGTWSNITARYPAPPSARWAATLVWDPLDHYMLLFGGRSDRAPPAFLPGFVNDTWAFNASTGWSRIATPAAPSPRGFAPAAYDPNLSGIVLFSGGDINFANGTLASHNDTWEYAGGVWTNITSTAGPGSRQATALTYDPNLGSLLASGIMANNSLCTPLRQTWTFNGTWHELNLTGPPPGGAMVYDAALGEGIYTGGCVPVNHAPVALTWTFAGGTWTNITSTIASSPSLTCCAAFAYDPVQKIDLRFGGNRVLPSVKTGYESFTYSFPVAPLTAAVAPSRFGGIAPLGINVTSLPRGGSGPFGFAWDFGDGSPTVTTENATHTFAGVGNFTVAYRVTDAGGRSYNATFRVQVGAALTFSAAANATTGEAPFAVNFTTTAPTGGFAPYGVAWTFGDGGVATGPDVTYTYLSAGSFTVEANLTDAYGDSVVRTLAVTVVGPVSATGRASVTVGVAPLSVTFTSSATGGAAPYSFAWTFGDGGSALGANTSHRYTVPGAYPALVEVTDGFGRTSTATVPIDVVAPLTASTSGSPLTGPAPLNVSFSSAAVGGLAPYSYSWTFGDGSTSGAAQVHHAYATAGNYTATVTIHDALGEVATSSVSVEVVAPLSVAAAASASAAVAPAAITFTATTGGGLGPYSYAWSFGDGSSGTGATATHTFATAGNFTATVTASDGANEQAVSHVAVTVVAALTATALAAPGSVDLGAVVNLTVTTHGGLAPLVYRWTSVPPGCSDSSAASLACTPSEAGTFTVTVDVTDGLHESINASTTVVVNAPSSGSNGGLLGGVSPLLLVGIGIVAAVIVLLAVLLLRGDRRPPPKGSAAEGPREIDAPGPEFGSASDER